MSIIAKRHVPNYVDVDNSGYRVEVSDTASLLAVPWIALWTKPGFNGPRTFFRFSVARDSRPALIAEFDNGDSWWVVAHLQGDDPDLPEWQITPAGQARVVRWNMGITS